MITSWRLCNRDHASLDGEGAKRFGGPWNSKGYALVYSSEYLPLATLEACVHLVRRPDDQVYMRILFDEAMITEVEVLYELPPDWKEDQLTTQGLGAQWVVDASSVVLSVPSAVVPLSRNFLINPNHPDFSMVELTHPIAYEFDDRLLDRVSATS